jgi:hypothetical protein
LKCTDKDKEFFLYFCPHLCLYFLSFCVFDHDAVVDNVPGLLWINIGQNLSYNIANKISEFAWLKKYYYYHWSVRLCTT